MKLTDDHEFDIAFDPEDVGLGDLVALSVGVHGVLCPEIVSPSPDEVTYETLRKAFGPRCTATECWCWESDGPDTCREVLVGATA